MRRHAKASFAGSTHVAGRKVRGLFGMVCLCVVGLAAFLGSGAPSAGADPACPNEAFRTGASANLPDCRAYEMVSPLGKNGGDIAGKSLRTRAASDGNALQFASTSGFGDAAGSGFAIEYVAVRTDQPGTQGWATHAITPPQEPGSYVDFYIGQLDPTYQGEFSDDLTRGVYMTRSGLTPAPNAEGYVNLYLRNDLRTAGPGNYQLLSDCPSCLAPPPGTNPFEKPGLAGASSDFGHVIFESHRNLTADAIGAGLDEELPKLYEWDHGTLRLAGILPDSACGSPPCPAPSSAAGHGVGADNYSKQYSRNTISADGTRIVFASPIGGGSEDPERNGGLGTDLYLRENHATTVQVNAEERTIAPDPPVESFARFEAASADLSRIFFTTREQLIDEDQTDTVKDLYMYDASLPAGDPHNLTRLVTDTEPDDGSIDGIVKVFGASARGDYLYFGAESQLVDDGVAGETVIPCSGSVSCIFVWHDGQIQLVGQIDGFDQFALADPIWDTTPNLWRSRVTPDGKHFLFLSDGAEGDPYDHTAGCTNAEPDVQGGGDWFSTTPGCAELYLYDASANGGNGDLTCASCNPGGAHTTATETRIDYTSPFNALSKTSHLSHPVSDDGRFVFFSTGEPLSPEDVNGSVYDVYRYDSVTGSVRLVSSGESPRGSFFLDASADGRDVFFVTSERLSGWDLDGQTDVYTARIGGGVADPPPPPPGCQGDACQPAPSALNDPTPASASLVGAGNLRPRQGCAKGQRRILRHGKHRCVKKKGTRHHKKNRADSNRRLSR